MLILWDKILCMAVPSCSMYFSCCSCCLYQRHIQYIEYIIDDSGIWDIFIRSRSSNIWLVYISDMSLLSLCIYILVRASQWSMIKYHGCSLTHTWIFTTKFDECKLAYSCQSSMFKYDIVGDSCWKSYQNQIKLLSFTCCGLLIVFNIAYI